MCIYQIGYTEVIKMVVDYDWWYEKDGLHVVSGGVETITPRKSGEKDEKTLRNNDLFTYYRRMD